MCAPDPRQAPGPPGTLAFAVYLGAPRRARGGAGVPVWMWTSVFSAVAFGQSSVSAACCVCRCQGCVCHLAATGVCLLRVFTPETDRAAVPSLHLFLVKQTDKQTPSLGSALPGPTGRPGCPSPRPPHAEAQPSQTNSGPFLKRLTLEQPDKGRCQGAWCQGAWCQAEAGPGKEEKPGRETLGLTFHRFLQGALVGAGVPPFPAGLSWSLWEGSPPGPACLT